VLVAYGLPLAPLLPLDFSIVAGTAIALNEGSAEADSSAPTALTLLQLLLLLLVLLAHAAPQLGERRMVLVGMLLKGAAAHQLLRL